MLAVLWPTSVQPLQPSAPQQPAATAWATRIRLFTDQAIKAAIIATQSFQPTSPHVSFSSPTPQCYPPGVAASNVHVFPRSGLPSQLFRILWTRILVPLDTCTAASDCFDRQDKTWSLNHRSHLGMQVEYIHAVNYAFSLRCASSSTSEGDRRQVYVQVAAIITTPRSYVTR